jgi:hypothetical protein
VTSTYCGAIENDLHLLFLCDLPRYVWTTANPSLPINTITDNENGVQLALPTLLSSNSIETMLCNTHFTLEYVWKV